MKAQQFGKRFASICDLAVQLSETADAEALLILLDRPTDWSQLKSRAKSETIIIAADHMEQTEGAAEAGLLTVHLNMAEAPVYEKLTQALLECVADDILAPGAGVVAVYSGFEASKMDSISFIHLDEHLGRLTARDLRKLETKVPLDTLKTVVDLAIDIGREGREGKPVGTMFVVGDTRKVLASSVPAGFDPVKGYKRDDRNLHDHRVRDGIKEAALMDGAFIISSDGTVEGACRLVDASAEGITLSKGLGARQWAAAGISKKSSAIAITVSESNGTVRIFQHGQIVLRIEPFRRAMKWKEFDYEPPTSTD